MYLAFSLKNKLNEASVDPSHPFYQAVDNLPDFNLHDPVAEEFINAFASFIASLPKVDSSSTLPEPVVIEPEESFTEETTEDSFTGRGFG